MGDEGEGCVMPFGGSGNCFGMLSLLGHGCKGRGRVADKGRRVKLCSFKGRGRGRVGGGGEGLNSVLLHFRSSTKAE